MPIDVKDIYLQAFEAHRHASDFRAKIIGGWSAAYTAFAAIFLWVLANHSELVQAVAIATGVMTIFMWLADLRNGPAIYRAKSIGRCIENDEANRIPENLRFFSGLATSRRKNDVLSR